MSIISKRSAELNSYCADPANSLTLSFSEKSQSAFSEFLPGLPGSLCRLSAALVLIITACSQLSPADEVRGGGAGRHKAGQTKSADIPEWSGILRAAFQSNISENTDEAYSKYRAALASAEKAQDTKGIISCLGALADFLDSRDILPGQDWPRKRALELSEGKFGKLSPEYAQQLAKTGGWYARSGSLAEARSYINRAVDILGNADSKYPLEKASCYIAGARLQTAEGSLTLADDSYKKALALQEGKFAPDHPVVLKTCREYAALLDRLGRSSEAAKMRERVYKARSLPSNNAEHACDQGVFFKAVQEGKAADLANDRARAFACWRQAVAEAEKRPDLDNQLPYALVRLGDEYRAGNQIAESFKFYKRAMSLREKSRSDNTLGMARNLERLALCYNAQNKWSEAEALLKRALDIEKKVQAGNQIIATTMESLLPACLANKDTKQAELVAGQLLSISEKQTGAAAANNRRMAKGVLSSIYIHSGRVDEGMKLLKELSSIPVDPGAYQARKAEIEKTTDQSELR